MSRLITYRVRSLASFNLVATESNIEFKELEVELRAVRDADPVYQDFVFVKQALADLAADVRCDLCCAYLRLLHSHSRCGLPGRLRSLGGTSRWRRAMHQGTVKPDS